MREMAWERPVPPLAMTSRSSNTRFFIPLLARLYSMLHPITPPPMMTASAVWRMAPPQTSSGRLTVGDRDQEAYRSPLVRGLFRGVVTAWVSHWASESQRPSWWGLRWWAASRQSADPQQRAGGVRQW